METETPTQAETKMEINIGFVVVTEWADGIIETETYQNEAGAIQSAKQQNSIEGVTSFVHKLALGEAIA